ncbi:MAG: hypothetical protein ACXWR1_04815 [Bdellovibrionota bacterium]
MKYLISFFLCLACARADGEMIWDPSCGIEGRPVRISFDFDPFTNINCYADPNQIPWFTARVSRPYSMTIGNEVFIGEQEQILAYVDQLDSYQFIEGRSCDEVASQMLQKVRLRSLHSNLGEQLSINVDFEKNAFSIFRGTRIAPGRTNARSGTPVCSGKLSPGLTDRN